VKKKPIKPIRILKKLIGSVFSFISMKSKKSNRIEPKPSQTKKIESNQFELVFCCKKTEPKSIGLNRFRFSFVFLIGLVTFFYKNQTENDHP
jgi:hypothetical protein